MKKPILIDLSHGLVGTFHGTGKSQLRNHISVHFTPLNSIRKIFIPDVPLVALRQCPIADDLTPKEGLVFLMSSYGGSAPVWEWLSRMSGEVFERISQIQTQMQTSEAARKVAERQVQKRAEEVAKSITETSKEIKKSTGTPWQDWGGKYRKRPDIE